MLIFVELDRAVQEREITVKRIKDGIAASTKKSGCKLGKLDKMSPELETDIIQFPYGSPPPVAGYRLDKLFIIS